MGQGYILDSNVIIDLIGKKLPIQTIEIIGSNYMVSSDISRIEVLGFLISKLEEESFNSFFNDLQLIGLTERVVLKSIEIRKFKKIKLGDAIIAATALVHDLTLITRNLNDFKGIEKLKILDSYQV